jgi:hypothetical protein
MLLENNYSTGIMHDNCHIEITVFLQYRPLEHHLLSSIMLRESSIMLLEISCNTGVTHDDHHMKITIFLQYRPLEHHLQSSITLLDLSTMLLENNSIIVLVSCMMIVI